MISHQNHLRLLSGNKETWRPTPALPVREGVHTEKEGVNINRTADAISIGCSVYIYPLEIPPTYAELFTLPCREGGEGLPIYFSVNL